MVNVRENLVGKKFGRLLVMYQTEDYIFPSNGKHAARWHCKCDCGNECDKLGTQLMNNKTHSCGCLTVDINRDINKKYNRYDLSKTYGIGYTENNEEFYFDLDDYDKIKNYCWCILDGYVVSKGNIRMHRIVMNCVDEEVDHINHKTNDNRKKNLRVGTHQTNMMNKVLYKNNTSGIPGINWSKSHNKWCVRIQINNKRINLGYYDDLNTAKQEREKAEKLYFQEYRYKGEAI